MDVAGSRLGFCAHCGKLAALACAICRDTFYCCKDHQRLSWKDHRPVCKYYKCIQEPSKKSYLVATRNIPKGKIVMRSKPIAVGPSGTKPVCLGCLRPIIYDVMSFQCEVCGWPVCNPECQKAEMHKAECDVMKKEGFRLEQEELSCRKWHKTFHNLPGPWLIALRVLLSNEKSRLSKVYREDDYEKKLPSSKLLENSCAIEACNFIKGFLKQKQFDVEEIAFVARVMNHCMLPVQTLKDHNDIFERRCASGVHASDMVYLQHSCLPNMQCIETVDEPLFMKVVSLKEIKAGEILTVNKSNCNLMSSTLQRQEVIQASKAILFDGLCACLRCRSPSELNLHCGSLLCKSCRGMVVPLSTSDLLNSDWACENKRCGLKVNRRDMLKIVNDLSNEYNQICSAYDGDLLLQNLVKFVENNSGSSGALNQQHFLIVFAKNKFCHEIFTQSTDKGASYKFDQKKLSRFFQYSSNLEDVLKLQNIDLSFVFFRGILVHTRSVIHKWVRKELSRKKAEEQLKMIGLQMTAKFQSTPIRDRDIEFFFANTFNELEMHFQRLIVASE